MHFTEVFGDPFGIDFEQARVALADRTPIGRTRHCCVIGHAGAQVRGHRDVDLLGMRQMQVFHEQDEVALVGLAADPRVVGSLLGDSGHRASAVVVCRIDFAVVGQAENLPGNRVKERRRIALLEIAAPGAADQQAVAGKR